MNITLLADEDLEILEGVVEEATEHLREIEEGILQMEVEPTAEVLDAVFRALHSIKGGAGFAGLTPLQDAAHALESLLAGVRKGLYAVDSEMTDLLLQGVDVINSILKRVREFLGYAKSEAAEEVLKLEIDESAVAGLIKEAESLQERLQKGSTAGEPVSGEAKSEWADLGLASGGWREDFIAEAREHLETVERELVRWEEDPASGEILDSVLRAFHSLKGGAALVESLADAREAGSSLAAIRKLTHAAETLLQKRQGQKEALSSSAVDLLLQVVDQVSRLLEFICEEREADEGAEVGSLLRALESEGQARAPEKTAAVSHNSGAQEDALTLMQQMLEAMEVAADSAQRRGQVIRKELKQYQRALGLLVSVSQQIGAQEVLTEAAARLARLEDEFLGREAEMEETGALAGLLEFLGETPGILRTLLASWQAEGRAEVSSGKTGLPESEEKLESEGRETRGRIEGQECSYDYQEGAKGRGGDTGEEKTRARAASEAGGGSIRVSQEKLDRMVNMVGELLIAKNRIFHLAGKIGQEYRLPELFNEVKAAAVDLEVVVRELQDAVMSARMVPLRVLFQRYPRVIRDLSRQLGKNVRLHIEGEDTELDKNVLEAIHDPLVHMLRNAVDHGLESPQERLAAGKEAQGNIYLRAYQEANSVVIEVSDDGRGLDADAIKFKALNKGLIRPEHIETMGAEEAYHLIFLPGFSTREEVTELSGRGVGMDVVKSNVEQLGGTVSIRSAPGQGTAFILRIPLSVSILEGLIVEVGGQRFAVALDVIKETIKVEKEKVRQYKNYLLADIRGEILPLTYLSELLGMSGGADDAPSLSVIVIQLPQIKVGLIVDRFHSRQEFVVKPLSGELAGLKIYSGATILGDGSVVLILNPAQLFLNSASYASYGAVR